MSNKKIVNILVIPKSSENKLILISENIFKAKVIALPEKGKANQAVIKLLAKYYKVSSSNITLKSGKNYKEKLFEVIFH